jgi:hypothetical protein
LNDPLVIAALFLGTFPAFSEIPASDLKSIVEGSGAGISWQQFERLAGPQRMNAAVRIGSALAHAIPHQAAWQSAKDLPPGDDREWLMRGILLELAAQDAPAGFRDLTELPAGGERILLARAFFGKWAALAPAKAADSVAGLPAGDTRDAALDEVLKAWAAADGPAAAQWVWHLPATVAGPPQPLQIFGMAGQVTLTGVHYDRGQAVQVAVFEWAKRDHRAALAWAKQVADPALRVVLNGLIAGER